MLSEITNKHKTKEVTKYVEKYVGNRGKERH